MEKGQNLASHPTIGYTQQWNFLLDSPNSGRSTLTIVVRKASKADLK